MTPREAKTRDDVANLKRDNISFPNFWMMAIEGEVTICEQTPGEHPKNTVTIPRKVFNQMVDWYNTGSKRGR